MAYNSAGPVRSVFESLNLWAKVLRTHAAKWPVLICRESYPAKSSTLSTRSFHSREMKRADLVFTRMANRTGGRFSHSSRAVGAESNGVDRFVMAQD